MQTLIGGDFYFAGRIVEPLHNEPRWLALGEDATGRRLSLVFTKRGDRLPPDKLSRHAPEGASAL